MNKKAEKMNSYLVSNNYRVRGYEVPNDPNHTVRIAIMAKDNREYIVQLGDHDVIGCMCVLAHDVDAQKCPEIYRVCNDLTAKYLSHSYRLDKDNNLCVAFSVLASDASFDPEQLIGYCCLIDMYVGQDLGDLIKVLNSGIVGKE